MIKFITACLKTRSTKIVEAATSKTAHMFIVQTRNPESRFSNKTCTILMDSKSLHSVNYSSNAHQRAEERLSFLLIESLPIVHFPHCSNRSKSPDDVFLCWEFFPAASLHPQASESGT
ncbi:hypothetical protein Enr17x_20990 [Gimesia fumaroli]|uniref:Uncharacterized protein n=1 Tax=Gimesia fumaroli TaxID=2527976 RepID=A0A518IAB5_9PLAN|nr:hypothetical protein Enr17x_20990 [Gimesia fumaroli]